MSLLSNLSHMADIKKEDRFYLRYYCTIIKARKLNMQVYGDSLTKGNTELKIEHPLRIACFTEEIKNQRISNYHMTWLVGLLHDTKEDDLVKYSENIDQVLIDLLPQQKSTVMNYIDQLTSDETLSKGEKKKDGLKKMESMDLIPCWIRIFDKYDNCRRFRKNPVGKTKKEIDGYCSIAFLCYNTAIDRFEQIRKNLQSKIKQFYEAMYEQLGGIQKINKMAQEYISENS